MTKPLKLKPKAVRSKDPILAAKLLLKQTKGASMLSHKEKSAVVKALSKRKEAESPSMGLPEQTETLARPHVREVLVEALAKIGVTPDKLAQVLAEGLSAKEKKFFSFEGQVTDMREVDDHATRHKFLDTALNLVGVSTKAIPTAPPPNVFVFRSHLGEKQVDVEIGAPTDAVVSRRLNAAKVRNRSHA